MLAYFWRTLDLLTRRIQTLDRTEWIYVFCGVVIVGFFCLRGFGSRKYY